MGAIQGSINQAMGAVAALAVGVKKGLEEKQAAEESFKAEGASLLKEQASLAGQSDVNTAKIEETQKQVDQLTKKVGDKRLKEGGEKKTKLSHDLEVAKKSLGDLQTQQDAIRKLRGINAANIETYKQKGGNI